MSNIQEKLKKGQNLSFDESKVLFSELMEGKHDFSAFRSIDCQSRSPIKTIKKIEVKKIKDIIYIKVIAKSFLMSQVRIIAGTLVEIGLKKKTEENIRKFQILDINQIKKNLV